MKKKLLSSILGITLLFVCGCSLPYTKDEIVKHYIDHADEITYKVEKTDPRWFYCFEQDKETSKKSFTNIFKSCLKLHEQKLPLYYSQNPLFYGRQLPYFFGVGELNEFKKLSYHCLLSKYLETNESFLPQKKIMTDENCRSMLDWYTISNKQYSHNSNIYDKYYDTIIKRYETENPGMLYCFKQNNSATYDLKTSLHEALNFVRDSGLHDHHRLPYGRKSDLMFESFINMFLKIYYGKRLTYFSTDDLSLAQKKECLNVVKPEIKRFYPNFIYSSFE